MDSFIDRAMTIVAEHGWLVQGVGGDGDDPPFAYTVGLTVRDVPEFIVCGLAMPTAHTILNDLGERVRAGQRFTDGDVLSDVLRDYDVRLVAVSDTRERLRVANTLFGGADGTAVRALQVVYPDVEGRWPWEAGSGVAGQPVLGDVE